MDGSVAQNITYKEKHGVYSLLLLFHSLVSIETSMLYLWLNWIWEKLKEWWEVNDKTSESETERRAFQFIVR